MKMLLESLLCLQGQEGTVHPQGLLSPQFSTGLTGLQFELQPQRTSPLCQFSGLGQPRHPEPSSKILRAKWLAKQNDSSIFRNLKNSGEVEDGNTQSKLCEQNLILGLFFFFLNLLFFTDVGGQALDHHR